MRKLTIILSLLLADFPVFADFNKSFSVTHADISNGYIVKKVWLEHYALPQVVLEDIRYRAGVPLPEEALPSNPHNFDIILGQERKKPFALVRIPAFASRDGIISELSGFTMKVTESAAPVPPVAAKTTASASPLAAGSWYKISVPATGLYKVDYDFLSTKLGINASSVDPRNIRVFGNGGRMLPENNAVPREATIEENAIWVNDGGDGTFGPGDYFVFYAIGPTRWSLDTPNNRFLHTKNLYEDKSYYFLNFDQAQGKRLAAQPATGAANTTVTSFNDYVVHEEDLYNPGKMGKWWWGEDFSTDPGKVNSRSFDLELGPVSEAAFRIQLGSRTPADNNLFSIWLNNQPMPGVSIGGANRTEEDTPVNTETAEWKSPFSSSTANIKLTFQPAVKGGTGYLGYIEVNTRRALYFNTSSLTFRDLNSVHAGNIALYQIGNANASTQVWDVTDPHNAVRMNGSLNGSTYSFTQTADVLHEFAAMNGASLSVPDYVGTVPNQDLFGSGQVDYVIIAHPDFIAPANRLADFHRQRSKMRVLVATPQQVYNEFSSGSQDISAIRDFVKMFYDRAGSDSLQLPKYLLLLGDASYDYKDRISNNTNFVPTFESEESLSTIYSFLNDDFYGFLDDNEYIENTGIANALDIGVGRLPVKTAGEANDVVNKIITYKSPASLGPWRLSTTMIADDEDIAGAHLQDAEVMDTTIATNTNIYNSIKVYEDAIPMVSTPGGKRAPNANAAINNQVYNGTLLLNYSGHGNTQVLSHERILTQDDYTKWRNINKLPFMVTATCDFGRFDHPDYVSAGERLILKNDGGVIAALTTTHLVYAHYNRILNKSFIDAQFRHVNGKWNTFGDAFRIGKNETYASSTNKEAIVNFRKFTLLGDPALEPDFPEYFITTDTVLDGTTMQPTDSIGALGAYIIKGRVTDVNGNNLDWFNGRANVTFYDKPRVVAVHTYYGDKQFSVRNNSICNKCKATVTNGRFAISFIAPKDINYEYGKGKISFYADNGNTDGAGTDTNFTVGGFSDNPVIEFNPPIVRPYIGDSLFRNGGLTGSNTLLFVILEDETGINVSGNSVGHDLTAVLDGDIANPYNMNDYYETEANTYKRGYVYFPISNLSDGMHRLTVKAWDANNNSGEGYVDFEVANGNVVRVQNLVNYPNPFRDVTHFRFEHNHPDETLNAELNIYNTAGVLVRKLVQTFTPTGSHSNEIVWDATADNGAKLPSGVYVYRMKISTQQSVETTAYQKLVIVR